MILASVILFILLILVILVNLPNNDDSIKTELLIALNNLENNITSPLGISSSEFENTLRTLSDNVKNLSLTLKSHPTHTLGPLFNHLKTFLTELNKFVGKTQTPLSYLFEQLKKILEEVTLDSVNEITTHIPNTTIELYDREFKTMANRWVVRGSEMYHIDMLFEDLAKNLEILNSKMISLKENIPTQSQT